MRACVLLVLAAVAACLPALAAPSLIAKASALHPLAAGSNPYFVARHAGLLYVAVPIAVLGSFAFFVVPGLFAVMLFGRARRVEELLLYGFAASMLVCVLLGTTLKMLLGTPLASSVFLMLWAATASGAAMLLIRRARRNQVPLPPVKPAGRRLALIGAGIWVSVALLVPKIFWENFNVDGVEAFEFGRSLTWHLFPHWVVQDGVFGFYHNFVLFAYPNHWFITLWGPLEAAARLPFFLYVALVFAALLLLIERAGVRPLRLIEEGTLWLGLALYIVIQTYNTNYDPFFADLAEMAATDTLWVLCFLAAVHTLWSGHRAWFLLFALLSYLASPGGLTLLATLAVCTFLAPLPERPSQMRLIVLGLVLCMLVGAAYEIFYTPHVFGAARANQFSAVSMLRRLFPPTLTEPARFNALLFTTGLLPALAITIALVRRRIDPWSFVVAGVTLLFFTALYVQPWTSLHQFTPVMILPLVVFWRFYLAVDPRWQRALLPSVAVSTLVCAGLSLPRHFQINLAARELGRATDWRVGDAGARYARATEAGWTLRVLVPRGYRLDYPEQPWGTDEYTWIYYATQPGDHPANYVVQDAQLPTPAGFGRLATREGISLYVRDVRFWQAQRERDLPRVVVSRLYEPILRQAYAFFRRYTVAGQTDSVDRSH